MRTENINHPPKSIEIYPVDTEYFIIPNRISADRAVFFGDVKSYAKFLGCPYSRVYISHDAKNESEEYFFLFPSETTRQT